MAIKATELNDFSQQKAKLTRQVQIAPVPPGCGEMMQLPERID